MKKLIFCVAVIALAGSIFGLTRINQNEGFSDIQLANIEALAGGEDNSDWCASYCTMDFYYRCWLELSTGRTIWCDNMTLKPEYDAKH